jgi:glycosyltransferase involved in cell wall biosynthesis
LLYSETGAYHFLRANLIMIPSQKNLTVAWISDFPIEWLSDIPAALQKLPRRHPATWQIVLLAEFEKHPAVRLHVILLRGQIEKDFSFERNGVTFHVLKASPKLRLASFFWLDTVKIRRVCRQIRPDVVHAWGSEKGASLIGSRLGYPYVMTIQGLFAWYKLQIKLLRYEQFVEVVERLSLKRARVITTESNFAVQFLRERYPALLIHQAEHAPNQAFGQISRRPQTQPFRFIAVGGIGFRKGTDLMIQALDRLREEVDYTMTFITSSCPDYIASLRSMASEETWARITFKHHLLPTEVAGELETAALLLIPTRADTSPNAVKEAVVAGVPVVASEIGGIPDYVVPGKNGELFPSEDVSAFVAAIRRACAHPLFREGRVDPATLVEKRTYLSPQRMADNFLEVYRAAAALDRKAGG